MGLAVIWPAGTFIPVVGPFVDVGGALAGHAVGRTIAAVRESKQPRAAPDAPEPAGAPEAASQIADKRDVEHADIENSTDDGSGVIPANFETPARSDTNR